MNKIKMLSLSAAFALLAACGGDALKGTFEVSSSVMGVDLPTRNIVLSSNAISDGTSEVKVDKWVVDGDVYTAQDKAGNALLKAKKIDGDNYELLGQPMGSAHMRRL